MTGEVLQAHLERRTRRYPGRAFDTVANIALGNEGAVAWAPSERSVTLSLNADLKRAKDVFDRLADPNAGYVDEHSWRFTPSSMRLIMQDLHELGLVNLKEVRQETTDGFEFFVSYSRQGNGNFRDRLTWLHMIAREQVVGYQQLLNGLDGPPQVPSAVSDEPRVRTH